MLFGGDCVRERDVDLALTKANAVAFLVPFWWLVLPWLVLGLLEVFVFSFDGTTGCKVLINSALRARSVIVSLRRGLQKDRKLHQIFPWSPSMNTSSRTYIS